MKALEKLKKRELDENSLKNYVGGYVPADTNGSTTSVGCDNLTGKTVVSTATTVDSGGSTCTTYSRSSD